MLEEFRSLPRFHKLSALASSLLIPALILFLGSSLVVGASFVTGTQPKTLTKKAFLFGFGASTGLFMIACGAMMKGDRLAQSELDLVTSRLDEQRQITENHRCKSCKYYSGRIELRCAVNPAIALTDDAKYCADWEEA